MWIPSWGGGGGVGDWEVGDWEVGHEHAGRCAPMHPEAVALAAAWEATEEMASVTISADTWHIWLLQTEVALAKPRAKAAAVACMHA